MYKLRLFNETNTSTSYCGMESCLPIFIKRPVAVGVPAYLLLKNHLCLWGGVLFPFGCGGVRLSFSCYFFNLIWKQSQQKTPKPLSTN